MIAGYKSAVLRRAFSGQLTADLRDGLPAANDLPAGWCLRALGDISDIQGGIQVGKKWADRDALVEVPYLRVANVQRGWLALDDVRKIRVTPAEKQRLLLRKGDILMNEGGDRDKLGRGWVWDEQIPECIHQNHVFRIRLEPEMLPPEYVSHFANEHGQRYFFDQGTQTTNLASISKRKVAALPVPVPPFDEAIEIVRRLEAALAWLDRVGANQVRAAQLLGRLDVAIHDKAFRGQLVAQDPRDEPSSVLLDRLRKASDDRSAPRSAQSTTETVLEEKPMPVEKSLEQILTEAADWISAQSAFGRCGHGNNAPTEDIERFYMQLRDLDLMGRLDVRPVTDSKGKKIEDHIRLKSA